MAVGRRVKPLKADVQRALEKISGQIGKSAWPRIRSALKKADNSLAKDDKDVEVLTASGVALTVSQVDKILEAVNDGDWFILEGALTPEMLKQFKDAGYSEIASMGFDTADEAGGKLTDVLDREADAYIETHGADLVTKITDSTRNMLRGTIKDALTEGWSKPELSTEIANNFAFSEARADMIAHTELAMAHSYGRIGVAQEAGATQKRWLLSADHDDDEDCSCSDAEDAGWVDLDASFVEGDDDYEYPPGHPRCQCDWVSDLVKDPDDDDEGDDEGDDEAGKVAKVSIDGRAHEAATSPRNDHDEPTQDQKSAGNYRKGHIIISGVDIAIENPAGSRRRPEWPILQAHYGYVKATEGADGDAVDVFVRVGTDDEYQGPVYVVDQVRPDGTFDEHKVLIGWTSRQSAIRSYLLNYTPNWKVGPVTRMTWSAFCEWLRDGHTAAPLSSKLKL